MTYAGYKMFSTEYLEFIVQNNAYILFEKGAPYNANLKRDVIRIMRDGKFLGVSVPGGYSNNAIELPREVFDDFLAASLIKQEGSEDEQSRMIFRATEDGKIRGHNRKTAFLEMADYVHTHWDSYALAGVQIPGPGEKEAKRIKIQTLALDLKDLATVPLSESLHYSKFEAVLTKLQAEGFFPPEYQVTAVTEAIKQKPLAA